MNITHRKEAAAIVQAARDGAAPPANQARPRAASFTLLDPRRSFQASKHRHVNFDSVKMSYAVISSHVDVMQQLLPNGSVSLQLQVKPAVILFVSDSCIFSLTFLTTPALLCLTIGPHRGTIALPFRFRSDRRRNQSIFREGLTRYAPDSQRILPTVMRVLYQPSFTIIISCSV